MLLLPNFVKIRVYPNFVPILGRIVFEPKKNRRIGNTNCRIFSPDSYRPYFFAVQYPDWYPGLSIRVSGYTVYRPYSRQRPSDSAKSSPAGAFFAKKRVPFSTFSENKFRHKYSHHSRSASLNHSKINRYVKPAMLDLLQQSDFLLLFFCSFPSRTKQMHRVLPCFMFFAYCYTFL